MKMSRLEEPRFQERRFQDEEFLKGVGRADIHASLIPINSSLISTWG